MSMPIPVHDIPHSQSSSITGASASDCLVSNTGHLLGKSYPSKEMQSVYSIALTDRAFEKNGTTKRYNGLRRKKRRRKKRKDGRDKEGEREKKRKEGERERERERERKMRQVYIQVSGRALLVSLDCPISYNARWHQVPFFESLV